MKKNFTHSFIWSALSLYVGLSHSLVTSCCNISHCDLPAISGISDKKYTETKKEKKESETEIKTKKNSLSVKCTFNLLLAQAAAVATACAIRVFLSHCIFVWCHWLSPSSPSLNNLRVEAC